MRVEGVPAGTTLAGTHHEEALLNPIQRALRDAERITAAYVELERLTRPRITTPAGWWDYNAGVLSAREAYEETMWVVGQRTRRNRREKAMRAAREAASAEAPPREAHHAT